MAGEKVTGMTTLAIAQPMASIVKPIHDFHILMDTLYPYAKPLVCMKNKRLEYSRQTRQVCYLLYEGHGLIHRVSDGLVLGTMKAPNIIGLASIIAPLAEEYYWRASSTSSVLMLETEVAREVISKNNLWEPLARTLNFLVSHLSEHSARLVAQNGYHLVCHQILSLMNEPAYIREKMSLPKYIIDRTLLSRSYVMKILAELRLENKIILRDKVLIAVNDLFAE